MPQTTASIQTAGQISWTPKPGFQLGEGFSIPSIKLESLLVRFLWCVYTWTEGAQQGCFQGTSRGKPISQESWMPDVKPVCTAERALRIPHRHQIMVWGNCCPDLVEIYVILRIITVIKEAAIMNVKITWEPDRPMTFLFCQSSIFTPSTQTIVRQTIYSWEPQVVKVRRPKRGVAVTRMLTDSISWKQPQTLSCTEIRTMVP